MRWTLLVGVAIVIAGIVLFSSVFRSEAPISGEVVSEPEEGVDEGLNVKIVNFVYTPKTLEIRKGETVTWTNTDPAEHTVTANDGLFDSGLLAQNERFSYTFEKEGTYDYYCIPHPYMKGRIIVK